MASNNAPETASVAEIERGIKNLSTDDNNATFPAPDYEWFKNHPWANKPPPEGDPEIENIEPHTRYAVGTKWENGTNYDLKKIVKDLPEFLNDMQKSTSDKGPLTPKSHAYFENKSNQAQSLSGKTYEKGNQMEYSVDVDGYMLKISIPTANGTFLIQEPNKVCIPKPELVSNGNKRWIFIPSYLRYNCALFDWTNTGIVEENTIRIVVVRPDQYDNYIKYCGHLLPIISLPEDKEGVGYARHWIQKIATEFGLPFIWMIDDSVKQFYEVHPDDEKDKEDKKRKEGKKDKEERKKEKISYKGREREFEKVFTEMEKYAKENKLAAISPPRFRGGNPGKVAFTYKPPVGAVYLNIKAINEKKIKYRPQLKVLEDVVFAAECVLKGKLRVGRFKQIQFKDMEWNNSGAAVYRSTEKDSKKNR